MTFTDTNRREERRRTGTGCSQTARRSATSPTAGFPTMSADSVSNTVAVQVGTRDATAPAAPTNLTATAAGRTAGEPDLDGTTRPTRPASWSSAAPVVAPAATCSNFAQIAAPGPRNNTGNVTYVDATVTAGNTLLVPGEGGERGRRRRLLLRTRSHRGQCPRFRRRRPASRVGRAEPTGTNYTATLTWARPGHQPDQLHDPARHQRHVHDGPEHLHGCRQPSGRHHADRESQHDLLLPDPGEQQHRRLIRLDERLAVPHSHGYLSKRSGCRSGREQSLPDRL